MAQGFSRCTAAVSHRWVAAPRLSRIVAASSLPRSPNSTLRQPSCGCSVRRIRPTPQSCRTWPLPASSTAGRPVLASRACAIAASRARCARRMAGRRDSGRWPQWPSRRSLSRLDRDGSSSSVRASSSARSVGTAPAPSLAMRRASSAGRLPPCRGRLAWRSASNRGWCNGHCQPWGSKPAACRAGSSSPSLEACRLRVRCSATTAGRAMPASSCNRAARRRWCQVLSCSSPSRRKRLPAIWRISSARVMSRPLSSSTSRSLLSSDSRVIGWAQLASRPGSSVVAMPARPIRPRQCLRVIVASIGFPMSHRFGLRICSRAGAGAMESGRRSSSVMQCIPRLVQVKSGVPRGGRSVAGVTAPQCVVSSP